MSDLVTGLTIGGGVVGLAGRFALATFQSIGGMKSAARSYIISGVTGAAIMGGAGFAYESAVDRSPQADSTATAPSKVFATNRIVDYIPR
jgi:hypothetical protein